MRGDDSANLAEGHARVLTGDPNHHVTPATTRCRGCAKFRSRGAGEIVLHDQRQRAPSLSRSSRPPAKCVMCHCVASGGRRSSRTLRECVPAGHVDAALAASVFHSGAIAIPRSQNHARRRRAGDARPTPAFDIASVHSRGTGLVPAIVQDADGEHMLMMAYGARRWNRRSRAVARCSLVAANSVWEKGDHRPHARCGGARSRLRGQGSFAESPPTKTPAITAPSPALETSRATRPLASR